MRNEKRMDELGSDGGGKTGAGGGSVKKAMGQRGAGHDETAKELCS